MNLDREKIDSKIISQIAKKQAAMKDAVEKYVDQADEDSGGGGGGQHGEVISASSRYASYQRIIFFEKMRIPKL